MDFAITLNPEAKSPLYCQLYEGVRRKILAGDLVPDQRVPSTRTLAKYLGVSRNTVAQAYNQLLSEGYFQATVGSGTFVCEQIPEPLIDHTLAQSTLSSQQRILSTFGASLVDFDPFAPPEPAAAINFRYGAPALDEFPFSIWRRLLSKYCRLEHNPLDYTSDLLGYQPLREAIAEYLIRSRQVHCQPEQIIIVNGSQQAIDLISRIFINRGDAVAIENPSYLGARQMFTAQGANVCPIPVDDSGLLVNTLDTYSQFSIKLIYVTPSHQFPTGAVMSLARRLELLNWSQTHDVLIIEDDYDGEYRYGERAIPALKELDRNDTVLYMGTFSKVLFPALRVGYLVLSEELTQIFCRAKWLSDRQSPLLEQYVLADFIREGHLERHVRRMRHLYNQRRQTLVKSLHQHLGQHVKILGENAGMHIMIQLNLPLSDREIMNRASRAGVGITSAKSYYVNKTDKGKFVLGYAELSVEEIELGVSKLSKVLLD